MVTVNSIVEKLTLHLNVGAASFHRKHFRTKNLVTDLPIEYMRQFMSEWLQLKQWAMMDTAFCCKESRKEFLGVLKSSLVTNDYQSSNKCFEWTVLRSIRYRRTNWGNYNHFDIGKVQSSYCRSQESRKYFLSELASIELVLSRRNHSWKDVLTALAKNCRKLECLYISGNTKAYSTPAANFLKTQPSLTKLDLYQGNIHKLMEGLLYLTNLKSISIVRSVAHSQLNAVLEVLRNNAQLTKVRLQVGKFSNIDLHNRTLELRIVELTPQLLEAFRRQCFTLTVLSLYKCKVTAEALNWICSKARGALKVLSVRRCFVTWQAREAMEAMKRNGVIVSIRD